MSGTGTGNNKTTNPETKNFAILLYAFTQGGEFRIHDVATGPTVKYPDAQYQHFQKFTQNHGFAGIETRDKYNQRVYRLIRLGVLTPIDISEEARTRKNYRVYSWTSAESGVIYAHLGIRGALLDKARECFALRSDDLREDSLRSEFRIIHKSNSDSLYMLWKKYPVSFSRASFNTGKRNTLLESFPQYKSFDSLVATLFSSRHKKVGIFVSGAREDGGGYYWTPRFIDFMQIYERGRVDSIDVSEEVEAVTEPVTEPVTESILDHNGTDLHLGGGDEADTLASEKSAILARLVEIEAREHVLAKRGEVVKDIVSFLELSAKENDCFDSVADLHTMVGEVVNK